MKIISKYKDYYDYLTGIYGIDPNIVLDRREYDIFVPSTPQKIVLLICGKRIEGFFDGTNFYYGENLKEFASTHTSSNLKWLYYHNKKCPDRVHIEYIHQFNTLNYEHIRYDIETKITDDWNKFNERENCPIILMDVYGGLSKYPRLINFDLSSFLLPEVIYQMLVDWLSNIKTKSENKPDNRTDVEKLISKGFDKKRSFRKMK